MKKLKKSQDVLDQRIMKTFNEVEQLKEQKLVSLFIKIIVARTLKEYYEKSYKIFEIQSDWTK